MLKCQSYRNACPPGYTTALPSLLLWLLPQSSRSMFSFFVEGEGRYVNMCTGASPQQKKNRHSTFLWPAYKSIHLCARNCTMESLHSLRQTTPIHKNNFMQFLFNAKLAADTVSVYRRTSSLSTCFWRDLGPGASLPSLRPCSYIT